MFFFFYLPLFFLKVWTTPKEDVFIVVPDYAIVSFDWYFFLSFFFLNNFLTLMSQ